MVVGEDRVRPAGAGGEVVAVGAEVARGGGGRVVEVVRVGDAVAVAVGRPGLPGRRDELERADRVVPLRVAVPARWSRGSRGIAATLPLPSRAGPRIGVDGVPVLTEGAAADGAVLRLDPADAGQGGPADVAAVGLGAAGRWRTRVRRARGSRPSRRWPSPTAGRPCVGPERVLVPRWSAGAAGEGAARRRTAAGCRPRCRTREDGLRREYPSRSARTT